MRIKLAAIVLLFTAFSFAQLSNFTLSVTKTDETCLGNGTLNFNVSGTAPGSTVIYYVFKLPDTTNPIAVLSLNTFTGLNAATYKVVATQSLGSLNGSQEQTVTIDNMIQPLAYQLEGEKEVCGNDGKITVNVMSGVATQYEIFEGPIIRPLQTSNIFSNLIAGQYKVRVFNSCGEGIVQTYTILHGTAGLSISANNFTGTNCDYSTAQITINNTPNNLIHYPLTVTVTVFPPNGGTPVVYNQTITSGDETINYVFQDIILYPNESYTYNISATDGCGNSYNSNGNIVDSNTIPLVISTNPSCRGHDINVYFAQSSVLISAPSTFPYTVPYALQINPLNWLLFIESVPEGDYTFVNTSYCGVQYTQTIHVDPAVSVIFFYKRLGCNNNFGTINGGNNLQTVIITSAPVNYPSPLPHNVSANIDSQGYFTINGVPSGLYTIEGTDVCGNSQSINVEVVNINETVDVNVIRNCNSFDIDLHYSWDYTWDVSVNNFWLQRLNPTTNQWENPLTGVVYNTGDYVSSYNALPLTNNTVNYNFSYLGTFRIIKTMNGVYIPEGYCVRQIYQFEYSGQPKINDVYSFACVNGTYDVLVDAVGSLPLQYRIVEKNNAPFVVQNGNSPVFLGLSAGHYKFQVEDNCGNIVNSEREVPVPFQFSITPQNLCDNQTASLTVPNFSILNYQWWKDNNTFNILSTTNSLQFSPLNLATDSGTYHVRVWYTGNPNTCIDFTLDYVVTQIGSNPNAGLDASSSYCGTQGILDLNTFLSGSFDVGGVWSETTSSGTLVNNYWNTNFLLSGTYIFKYKVTGTCNLFDEATVSITLKPIPATPTITSDALLCEGSDLHLNTTTVANAVYSWTGPNGFTSSLQNPVIGSVTNANSGAYNLTIIVDGCPSQAATFSVNVGSVVLAGTGTSSTYCGNQGQINLFNLLTGTYTAGGTWTETSASPSGTLAGNIWDSSTIPAGTYTFDYSVSGCTTATATVSITINNIPITPSATVSSVNCSGGTIQLFATTISGATYSWTGPNGFTSSQQNPEIQNVAAIHSGQYTVFVSVSGCTSATASVSVLINENPDFEIVQGCDGNKFRVEAIPISNSFDPTNVTYTWTGPNGFTSTQNPPNVAGQQQGNYSVTVTTASGCSTSVNFELSDIAAQIPKGISPDGDGLNDEFNLAGLCVKKVEIFNRYGVKVFEKEDYTNEWHGQNEHEKLLPSGTYYYYIEFAEGTTTTGWVYLALEK